MWYVCSVCVYVCMPNVSEVINGQRDQEYGHHSQLDRATFTTLQRGVARECHFEGVGLTICACVCVRVARMINPPPKQ